MAETTNIEWCDSTWNPWLGCTKISPACDDCYAARSTPARALGVVWGPHEARRRTSATNWELPMRWERQHQEFFAQHGRRRRVFCASLADVFDNEVPVEWRRDLFSLIELTPNLDWLLLTKRVGNVQEMVRTARTGDWLKGRHNVWLGATICNQEEADRDIPKLLALPARVRFLSIEPMLGSVDLTAVKHTASPGFFGDCLEWYHRPHGERYTKWPGIDWVICGGESGPKARPMHPDWARSLRDQCAAAGVSFMFKQWGEWLPIDQQDEAFTNRLYRSNRKAALHQDQGALDDSYGRTCTVPYGVVHLDGSFHEPLEPMAFGVGTGAMTTFKVGKKAAGRLLDGVEHNGFPEVGHV